MPTGQERDGETGLDFMHARYYGAALGRFTSPDPANAGADLMNPQSWNAYSYVANNPLVNVDPTGTCASAVATNYDPQCQDGPWEQSNGSLAYQGGFADPFQLQNIPVKVLSYVPGQAPNFTSYAPVNASGYSTSETITFGTPPSGSWQWTPAGNASNLAWDTPLEGWGESLRLVGQNVDAQKAFLGKFALASASTGAGANIVPTVGELAAWGGDLAAYGRSMAIGATFAGTRAGNYLFSRGSYFFAQGDNKTIPKGILNNNDYLRIGISFNGSIGREVFRVSIGSRRSPLPSWIPGLIRGTLHIDLWSF